MPIIKKNTAKAAKIAKMPLAAAAAASGGTLPE